MRIRSKSHLLWNCPSVHSVNKCPYDWFNKQADWPVAEQDKVRWESQTETDGKRKGGVRGIANQTQNKSVTQNEPEVKDTSLG